MLTRRPFATLFIWLLYACSTLQFVRFYVVTTTFYLSMPLYLQGKERLPFQERILPVLLMWPINHVSWFTRHFEHAKGGFDAPSAATHELFAFYVLSLVSFAAAAFFTVRLYRAVTQTGALAMLVFPVFLVLTLWAYVIHIDGEFSFPYDLPSLAFFTGGLLAVYTRRYWPLFFVVLIGTTNRETTLFLIPLFIIDAASRDSRSEANVVAASRKRFIWHHVPWARAALLFAVWLAVKLSLHHHFVQNDNSENYVRLRENVNRLQPRLWPILFNICGYILPVVLLFNSQLRPARFRNYLLIFPIWFAVMFYTGVILETRIYGELCSFTAVAAVLLLEAHVARRIPASAPEIHVVMNSRARSNV